MAKRSSTTATASEPTAGQPREIAIPQLVERHGDKIYAIAARLCHNPSDADDLVQEVFMQAWRHWNAFEGRSSPTTWLYQIAAHACQRMHRPRAGEPNHIGSLTELSPFSETSLPTRDAIADGGLRGSERAEARDRVQRAIASLPVNYRIPLILKDIIELPVSDVAAILGLAPGTVKTRVHRARLQIRKGIVSGLPARPANKPAYAKQLCLDLLKAKQDALDRGVAFAVRDEIVCERCRGAFDSLDLSQELCREALTLKMPRPLRKVVERAVKKRAD